jgi:dihydroorotase
MLKTLLHSLFFLTVLIIPTVAPVLSQPTPLYDILLKGGHVIDPANDRNQVADIAVTKGKITLVGDNIPVENAVKTIDVRGYLITPGFVDIHVHVFHTFKTNAAVSLQPDNISFPFGVTTVVDAGTSGALSFEQFKNDVIDKSQTRVLGFINIAAPGMNDAEQDPLQFDVQAAVAMAKKYPEYIVGFKTAHYWTSKPYDTLHTPWASVDSLLAAGNAAGLPVMIDFYPRAADGSYPARTYRELILEKMRPGDIHTHVFAEHIPTIRGDGTVEPDVLAAQKRGVVFDVGHGAGSFIFAHATPALQQNFYPNSISTDLHQSAMTGAARSMIHVMSKLLCLGMPLEEVIRRSTINPAREINRPELGNLSPGSPADIAVISLIEGMFYYSDVKNIPIKGDKKLECQMTLFGGETKHDPAGLSRKQWVPAAQPEPVRFAVDQNMPNPFNPATTISFTVEKAGHTTAEIFNTAGQKIATILSAHLNAGRYSVTWDASGFSAGVYFYTVTSGSNSMTRKMTVAK